MPAPHESIWKNINTLFETGLVIFMLMARNGNAKGVSGDVTTEQIADGVLLMSTNKRKAGVEAFSSQLSDELKPLFEAVLVDKLEIETLEQTQAFVDGFKLGAKLLVEVFAETPAPEKE